MDPKAKWLKAVVDHAEGRIYRVTIRDADTFEFGLSDGTIHRGSIDEDPEVVGARICILADPFVTVEWMYHPHMDMAVRRVLCPDGFVKSKAFELDDPEVPEYIRGKPTGGITKTPVKDWSPHGHP